MRHFRLSKGSDVRPGVPPGVPWAPGFCACILRGRRGTSGSPRGLMYALASPLASLGLRALCLHFAWQAWHFRLSKGSDVRPGVHPGVPWALGLCARILSGTRGTSGSPRGLMYALASPPPPGVPWAPGLCASILRGRRGTAGSPRGLMYALASPLASLGLRASVLAFCVAGAALQALQGV